MTDTIGKIADFVQAGQAAQAAVDKLTSRPSLATIAVDAAELGTRLERLVQLLDDAAAHRANRRHTNAAALEQMARAQARYLLGALEAHFRRFLPERPAGSRYSCTCGWELRGQALEAMLAQHLTTPGSIRCQGCGGVAVRPTS